MEPLAQSDYNLAAGRYKPLIVDSVPDDDTVARGGGRYICPQGGESTIPMTIDELIAQAAQLSAVEQEELVRRLLALRRQPQPRSVLPPGAPGSMSRGPLKQPICSALLRY
jgi:hypothetical protein